MTHKVERSLHIDAPPERVWQAWVHEMNGWWGRPYYNDAERVTGLLLEPKLGGRYIEQWGENGEGCLIGLVTEWLPPQRLAYTWSERSWAGAVTLIEIDFQPAEGGGTRMSYTQSGFERLPDAEDQRRGYEHGAGELTERLKAYIEKG